MTVIDTNELIDAAGYAAHGYPHELWARMRRESPVHWCEPDQYRPFWAVTRYDDIKWVSSRPDLFASAPRTMLIRQDLEALGTGGGVRSLVHMDPPDHRDHRAIASPCFRPGAMRTIEGDIRDLTRRLLDQVAGRPEPFDFVTEFASWLPLKVICHILGVDEEDEPLVLRIANVAFGLEDPEFAPQMAELVPQMLDYYKRIMDGRMACPTDDVYGVIASAKVGGEPIGIVEMVSYFLILTTAGHDTTRNALTGGLLALIEHPDQLELLRERPDLCGHAADEILRWTSPVTQFCRTATEDTTIAGQPIRAGDDVALFYPSGNRDESVFDDPFEFRVDRDPNPQIAFGFGEHFCLGAHLARMEIRIYLEELLPRLESVSLAGAPERTAATLVHGVKHLPIQWRLHT